jgi:hypothetical protein
VVVASNLSVGSGVIVIFSCWAHLTASARFRGRATRTRIRPVIHDDQLEGWSCSRGFPSPFGHRHSLLGHPIPAGELGPPHGRLTGHDGRTPTGLPRSARMSSDRGGCSLDPGDGGAPPGQAMSLTGACRSTAASPYTPLQHPIPRGSA